MIVRSACFHLILVAASLLILPGSAARLVGQVVNPATGPQVEGEEHDQDEGQPAADDDTGDEQPEPRKRSWEYPRGPDVTVTASRLGKLREEDRIGSYGQPRWTAQRLFPATRIYVRPEGTFGFEYWNRIKEPRHGDRTVETMYEVEFGLPYRMQLDLYFVTEKTGNQGELDTNEQKVELRYALADWDEIWGNPTLYFEYVQRDAERDAYEAKLLLGGEVTEGWHWGSNLVLERELGSMPETVYELTLGLSHTLEDEKFALGGEAKIARVDAHDGNGGDHAYEFEVGPSLRWKPNPAMHVDFAPLVGLGGDSRQLDVYLVLGWEF